MSDESPDVVWLEDVDSGDVATVGGKNASLGEMIQSLGDRGIRVPSGFATTAQTYRSYLAENDLIEAIGDHVERIRGGGDLAGRLAVHRPCDQLPGPPRFRPHGGRAFGLHPADGALR